MASDRAVVIAAGLVGVGVVGLVIVGPLDAWMGSLGRGVAMAWGGVLSDVAAG